jgi:hypothetical protein
MRRLRLPSQFVHRRGFLLNSNVRAFPYQVIAAPTAARRAIVVRGACRTNRAPNIRENALCRGR